MIVIIKSAPDTDAAHEGISIARDNAADVILIKDAVMMAQKDGLQGYCGMANVLKEDLDKRAHGELEKGIRILSAREIISLIASEDKVMGPY